MTTTPLPLPMLIYFDEALQSPVEAYTATQMREYRADLEAEVARLREALEELLRHFTRSPSSLADSEARIKAHAALKEQP